MRVIRNIQTVFIALGILLLTAICPGVADAQLYDRSRLTSFDQAFTIGFERQVYSLYSPSKPTLSKKTIASEQKCSRILLRMKLNSRFRLETGLSYQAIDRLFNTTNKNKCLNTNGLCKLSVPLTIQYQLQTERYRLHPYFGAGVQYNSKDKSQTLTNSGDVFTDPILSNSQKYMSLIFTEGLIYDVTPNIQITQSIHIVPDNGIKPIGINFGIGYRIK